MAKQHGLSTLIEAARFLEVSDTKIDDTHWAQDDSDTAKSRVGICQNGCQDQKVSLKPRRGCLRTELQSGATISSQPVGQSFQSNDVIRQDHNRMEKLRRKDMQRHLQTLKNRIPSLQSGRYSSVAVLQSAVDYIHELKVLEKSLASKHQVLCDEHKALRLQLVTMQQSGSSGSECDHNMTQTSSNADDKVEENKCNVATKISRKRTHSESSTISADSPKMFFGNRDSDLFLITEQEKLATICKTQCTSAAVCKSPTSTTKSTPTLENVLLPSIDCGLMSPPDTASNVSRNSGTRNSSPASSIIDDGHICPKRHMVETVLKKKSASEHENQIKTITASVGDKFSSAKLCHQSTPLGTAGHCRNDNLTKTVTSSDKAQQSSKLRLPMRLCSHKLKSPVNPQGSDFQNLPSSGAVSQIGGTAPTRIMPQSPVSKNVLPINMHANRRICIVGGGAVLTSTATVTPIIVTPVTNGPKPAQIIFLQPANSQKNCQPVVLLTSPPAVNKPTQIFGGTQVTNDKTIGQASSSVTTMSANTKNNSLKIQPMSNTVVLATKPISERTLESHKPGSTPVLVLRRSGHTVQPIKTPVKLLGTSYPTVISVLSPPATPSSSVYSSDVVCQEKSMKPTK